MLPPRLINQTAAITCTPLAITMEIWEVDTTQQASTWVPALTMLCFQLLNASQWSILLTCSIFLQQEGKGWFKFDDECVTPISEDNLKTPAAYVLFYRREWVYNCSTKHVLMEVFFWQAWSFPIYSAISYIFLDNILALESLKSLTLY
jgi:hypothetical protein